MNSTLLESSILNKQDTTSVPKKTSIISEFMIAVVFFAPFLFAILNNLLSFYNLSIPLAFPWAFIVSASIYLWARGLIKNPFFSFSFLIIFGLILLLTSLLYPKNLIVIFNFGDGSIKDFAQSNIFTMMFLCYPFFIQAGLPINTRRLFKIMVNFSYLIVLLFILVFVTSTFIFSKQISNYMSLSYSTLPSLMIIFGDRKRLLRTLFVLIGFLFLILTGCRGAILCFVALLLLNLFEKIAKKGPTFSVVFLLVILLFGIIIVLELNNIINFISTTLEQLNISSRFFEKLVGTSADGGILEFSGRQAIIDKLTPHINFLGIGIFGDQLIADTYVHNIILEIVLDFGWFFGVILLVALSLFIFACFRTFHFRGDLLGVYISKCFLSLILTKMMFSATYLTDTTFWMFLSLLLIMFINYKKTDRRII